MKLKRILTAALTLAVITAPLTSFSANASDTVSTEKVFDSLFDVNNEGAKIKINLDDSMAADVKVEMTSAEGIFTYYDEVVSSAHSTDMDYIFPLDGIEDATYSVTITVPKHPGSEKSSSYVLDNIVVQNPLYTLDFKPVTYNLSLALTSDELDEPSVDNEETVINDNGTTYKKTIAFHGFTNAIGDVNGDGVIDAIDASEVLTHYATISTGGTTTLPTEMYTFADVNGDGVIDAIDAASILTYYAKISTGLPGTWE